MNICQACNLPVFSGPAAYAGDTCKCQWKPIPGFKPAPNELWQRVAALEAQVAYLMRRIDQMNQTGKE